MSILRLIKILLIVAVCLWGLLGALGNLLDWQGTRGAVSAAAAMSGWEGGASDWRATSNPVVITAAALSIVTFKVMTAFLCGLGALRMWHVRAASIGQFGRAKAMALSGCGIAIFGLFVGWIVLGEQWFEMWRSPPLAAAAGAAFRYAGFIALIAVFVAMREE